MSWRINFYDTSTPPTQEMRDAMQSADVGDDIYQEDPTVIKLETEAALIIGKESALFMPSGTMGNLVGLMSQSNHGEEIIIESESHIYYYETGGLSSVAGLIPRLVNGKWGVLDPLSVKQILRKPNIHYPRTAILCVENTHNRGGGTITPPETMKELWQLAHENGLSVHLDGARIFNAATAMHLPVTEFTQYSDTVMFCLSKGLGAPVGSILAGTSSIITKARRIRKMLGGGMRKSGFLAAAGLVALRTGIEQLSEDHRKARILAEALRKIPTVDIDLEQVQTNMVLLNVMHSGMSAEQVGNLLMARGIKVSIRPPFHLRLVTHKGISLNDIDEFSHAIDEICAC